MQTVFANRESERKKQSHCQKDSMEITTNAKKRKKLLQLVGPKEKRIEAETLKLCLTLFLKRRKDDKQKLNVHFALWPAPDRPNL